jgi:hypothetical protein
VAEWIRCLALDPKVVGSSPGPLVSGHIIVFAFLGKVFNSTLPHLTQGVNEYLFMHIVKGRHRSSNGNPLFTCTKTEWGLIFKVG